MRSADPPTISYRSDPEPASETFAAPEMRSTGVVPDVLARFPYRRVMNQVFSVLTWAILAVVLLVWAVIGAIFWIPLIVRAMLRFSISLIEAMFEGQKPVESARILRNAVSFYRRGFVVAVEVVTKEEVEDLRQPRSRAQAKKQDRLLVEVVWALVVWYFLALWAGWIQTSPLDLWHSFLALPWGDAWNGLLDLVGL